MATRDAQIIIIGAGIAGLSTAEQLYRNGFNNIKILEAKNRIGGRMWTTNFGKEKDEFVELGAQYIGGLVQSCSIYVLANQIGLKANAKAIDQPIRPTSLGHVFSSDGRIIQPYIVERCNDLFNNWWLNLGNVRRSMTMEECLTEYIDTAVLPKFEEEERSDVRSYFNYFRNWLRLMEGIAPSDYKLCVDDDVNAPNFLPGNSYEADGRLDSLINEISRRFPPEVIHLSSPVTRVKWGTNNTEVTCSVQGLDKTYTADYVVVTCPLGHLKKYHETMFEPRLPIKKVEAIKAINFGCIGKAFLEYEQPFWETSLPEIAIAWTDEEFSEDVGDQWWKRITHMEAAKQSKNVLQVWVSGDGAAKMGEISDEEAAERITWLLRKVLRNPSIPEPIKVIKAAWASDPWTLGVYSCTGDTTYAHRRDLKAPLEVGGKPKVFFAGEATDEGYGYMHGARDSGLSTAETIIHQFDSSKMKSKL